MRCGKPLPPSVELFPGLTLDSGRSPAARPGAVPFGVGGWLAVLVISLIIFCPIRFSFRVLEEFRLIQAAGFALLTPVLYRAVDLVACLGLAAGGIFTGWALLEVHRNTRRIAEIYILLVCVYYAVRYLLALTSPSICYLAKGATDFAPDGVLSSCIWAVLWIAYLRRSKRVANTYGMASATTAF